MSLRIDNNMNAVLKIWTDAKKIAGANVVGQRVKKRLGAGEVLGVEIHHKGGFEVRLEVPLSAQSWAELVYELITISQRLAHTWTISSTVETEAYLVSNEVPVPGVTSAHLFIVREK